MYFSVQPDKYLIDGAEFGKPNACVFGIFPHVDASLNDRFILGVPFLGDYYTIFDQDKARIGFAMQVFSRTDVRQTFSQGVIFFIAISVILLFPLSLLGIYQICEYNKARRRELTGRDSAASQATFLEEE